MPSALHPQAKFDPIPPDLDLHDLVERTTNFHWVTRISTQRIRNLSPSDFERLILKHVIENGRPLVIEGWNKALPSNLFSVQWLENTYNKKRKALFYQLACYRDMDICAKFRRKLILQRRMFAISRAKPIFL